MTPSVVFSLDVSQHSRAITWADFVGWVNGVVHRGSMAALALFTAGALGFAAPSHAGDIANDAEMGGDLEDEAPIQLLVEWPHDGPLKPGDRVTVFAEGFPASTRVEFGAGPPQSEYIVLGHGKTNEHGVLRADVVVPAHADPSIALVFVAATHDFRHQAISAPLPLNQDPASAPAQPTPAPAVPLAGILPDGELDLEFL